MRLGLTLAVVAVLTACAPSADDADSGMGQLFRGWYEYGFEMSQFVPCGADTVAWWVTERDSIGGRAVLNHLKALEGRSDSTIGDGVVYAVFRGDTSALGQYGHLGGYTRELRVSAVDTLRRQGPSGCPRPASRYGAT